MTKKVYTIFGIILGLIVVLFGLLNKRDLDDNFIVANDNTLKLFYLANRNLEEPVFIKYEDLSETQISLIKKDYIPNLNKTLYLVDMLRRSNTLFETNLFFLKKISFYVPSNLNSFLKL